TYEKTTKGWLSYTFCDEGVKIPTTTKSDGTYYTGELNWINSQKEAIGRAMQTLENTFANVPGRSIRIAFTINSPTNQTVLASTNIANRFMDDKKTWTKSDLQGLGNGKKASINDVENVWKYGKEGIFAGADIELADVVIQLHKGKIEAKDYIYDGIDPLPIKSDYKQIDLETLILHEMGHAIGFNNGMSEKTIQDVIIPASYSALDVLTTEKVALKDFSFLGSSANTYSSDGVFLETEMGITRPSHLNKNYEYKDIVMDPSGLDDKTRRQYSELELNMFKDMGWTLARDAVPEPTTCLLTLTGVMALLLRRSRSH
ncbi:MAG: leishmanolysin-related zinc metalloendopeptidase, partial [Akkermansia sp.]